MHALRRERRERERRAPRPTSACGRRGSGASRQVQLEIRGLAFEHLLHLRALIPSVCAAVDLRFQLAGLGVLVRDADLDLRDDVGDGHRAEGLRRSRARAGAAPAVHRRAAVRLGVGVLARRRDAQACAILTLAGQRSRRPLRRGAQAEVAAGSRVAAARCGALAAGRVPSRLAVAPLRVRVEDARAPAATDLAVAPSAARRR